MNKTVFVDGIGNIAIAGGVARIELLSIDKVPSEGKAPAFEVSGSLAMSLDTLLRLFQGLQQVADKLEDKGVIKKKESSKKPN